MESPFLSPREQVVLHLIVWGYTNKEIAARLRLSVKTVEAHKYNGMRKIKAHNRATLVRSAVAYGWLRPSEDPSLASR